MVDQPWGDICDGAEKRRTLLEACARLGIEPRRALAVGDGANDLPMMGAAGLSIAFHAKPRCARRATIAIVEGGLDRALEIAQALTPASAALAQPRPAAPRKLPALRPCPPASRRCRPHRRTSRSPGRTQTPSMRTATSRSPWLRFSVGSGTSASARRPTWQAAISATSRTAP